MGLLPALVAITGTGLGLQVLGGYQASQQKKAALSYNEDVANIKARQAREEAEYKAGIEGQRQRRLLGRQESLFGKTGTMPGGSALDVLADQALTDEMNLLAIRYGGESEAYAQRSRADLYGAEREMEGDAGNIRTLGGIASGIGTTMAVYQAGKKKDLDTRYSTEEWGE